jgi:Sulfotransferase domain
MIAYLVVLLWMVLAQQQQQQQLPSSSLSSRLVAASPSWIVQHQRNDGMLPQPPPLTDGMRQNLRSVLSHDHTNQNISSHTTTTVTAPDPSLSSSSSSSSTALEIVWLMSFPNSGTSYTSRLVRDATQTFTASNYADETPEGQLGVHVPVFTTPHKKMVGPFWTIPAANQYQYIPPPRYVLTKTHCGIRCSLCSPNEYAETTYSFRRRCLVTKWVEYTDHPVPLATNITTTTVATTAGVVPPPSPTSSSSSRTYYNVYSTYNISQVSKAVHLIRNPFDNVVSRFHLERNDINRTAKNYTPNRHGFLRYCMSIDYKYTTQEIKYLHFQDNPLLQDLWLVPCHADFMRYVEWHNLAFFTTADAEPIASTYVLHYEWYTTRFDTVVTELLSFLQLPRLAAATPIVPFETNKVYDDYYTMTEKLIVKRAFEFMASRPTWEHVRHYFPDG